MTNRETGRARESRDDIVARVQAEQEGYHPAVSYEKGQRVQVWVLGAIMVPISILIGFAIGYPLGWPPFLWVASGLGISLGVFYLVYVVLAERDDGRIQREIDAERERRGEGAG